MSGRGCPRFPTPVTRLVVILLLLGGVALAGVASHLAGGGAQARVYTVAELRERLAGQPAAWEGRQVLVRGMAVPCPWQSDGARWWGCADQDLVLMGDGAAPGEPLPIERSTPNPLVALARKLPILDGLLPWPDGIPLYVMARFRVRLQTLPPSVCWQTPCYEARVLDVAAG